MELGQVFTSKKVAQLMVKLIEPYLKDSVKILDPCIGKNIFLKQLSCSNLLMEFTGIEIDNSLIDENILNFFNNPHKLVIGDFFDFDLKNKYDFIILNPPYIRQERIQYSSKSKMEINFILNDFFPNIPAQSNLYVYFLLKSLIHLKNDGFLTIIIYDSWIYSDFGNYIKEILIKKYNIEKIIHFKHGAFENVNVGATILLLSNRKQSGFFEYASFNSPSDIDIEKLEIEYELMNISNIYSVGKSDSFLDFDDNFFIPIRNISEKPIKRGTTALVNKFFIFEDKRFNKFMKPIIKQVTKVPMFEAKNTHYLLSLPKNEIIDNDVKLYIAHIKRIVEKDSDKYKSLKQLISNKKYWFSINYDEGGNIIFNYYMRDNIHFLLNSENCLVSDNFYNIYITENVFEELSILNSSFTTYTLLKHGKNQGKKLFKIQLKQFKEIPIINLNYLSIESREKLQELGKLLLKTRRKKSKTIISLIDKLLIKEYNNYFNKDITYEEIIFNIDKIKNGG